jgi:hypothetical protein
MFYVVLDTALATLSEDEIYDSWWKQKLASTTTILDAAAEYRFCRLELFFPQTGQIMAIAIYQFKQRGMRMKCHGRVKKFISIYIN